MALWVFGLISLLRWSETNPNPETLRPPDLGPVLRVFREENVYTTFAQYWVAYRINFETKESVTAAALDNARYTPYQERVKASARPAYVLLKGSVLDNQLKQGFEQLGIPFRRDDAGGFIVDLPYATVLPDGISGL